MSNDQFMSYKMEGLITLHKYIYIPHNTNDHKGLHGKYRILLNYLNKFFYIFLKKHCPNLIKDKWPTTIDKCLLHLNCLTLVPLSLTLNSKVFIK